MKGKLKDRQRYQSNMYMNGRCGTNVYIALTTKENLCRH